MLSGQLHKCGYLTSLEVVRLIMERAGSPLALYLLTAIFLAFLIIDSLKGWVPYCGRKKIWSLSGRGWKKHQGGILHKGQCTLSERPDCCNELRWEVAAENLKLRTPNLKLRTSNWECGLDEDRSGVVCHGWISDAMTVRLDTVLSGECCGGSLGWS